MGGGNPSILLGTGYCEPLASRKGVDREVRSEGSETAKVGTDPSIISGRAVEEPDKRLFRLGQVALPVSSLSRDLTNARKVLDLYGRSGGD